jgi:Zn-dependent protease with chaperone function
MFTDLPGGWVLAVVIALAPAVLRWWWGRALGRLVDDAAFSERLSAHRVRAARAFGVGAGLLVFGWPYSSYWTFPLLIFSRALASYPLRRQIFGETWSVFQYLSVFTRIIVALLGFWILLAMLPAVALLGGASDGIAAGLIAGLLLAWSFVFAGSVRFMLASNAIEDANLLPRFEALARKCNIPMPRFERVDLHGGAIANAIALPSSRRSTVLFTDTLLAQLEADEIVAICGHELAHLEHFNARRMRRLNLETRALIVASFAVVLIGRFGFEESLWPVVAWSCVLAFVLAWRVRDRQRHETESDLRAVELTGDPEALARGLTKIHAFARIPRRLNAEVERQSTHPSLARRIRAIRAAANATPATLTGIGGVRLTAPDGRTVVTFGDERLEWHEGSGSIHHLPYTGLSELRLQAHASGPARLVVVEEAGRRWEMTLSPDEVGRAQAMLDTIDGQLPDPVAPTHVWPTAARTIALIVAAIAMMALQIAAGVVALVTMSRPVAPLLGATGVSAIGAGLLALRHDWLPVEGSHLWISLILTVLGVALLKLAWDSRQDPADTKVARIVGVIGALAALVVGTVLTEGSLVRMHQTARATPTAVVLPLALAGALACGRKPLVRAASVPALCAGLAVAAVGSVPFLDRWASDPFLVAADGVSWKRMDGAVAVEFSLPFYAMDVRLSPDASHVAVEAVEDRVGGQAKSFHTGRVNGPLVPIDADDLVFLDANRVLLFDSREGGVELRSMSLDPEPKVEWRQHIADVYQAHLLHPSGSRGWRVVGWDRSRGQIVRAEGQVGSDDIAQVRWPAPKVGRDARGWPTATAAATSGALVLETRYDAYLSGQFIWRSFLLSPGHASSQLRRINAESQDVLSVSEIDTACVTDAADDDRLVCTAFDGTRTRILAIDPATSVVSAVAILDGRFMIHGRPAHGWLTGWKDSRPAALRLATREGWAPSARTSVYGLAVADRFLGTVSGEDQGVVVRLFPMEVVNDATRSDARAAGGRP